MLEAWREDVKRAAASLPPIAVRPPDDRLADPVPDLASWCRQAGAERMITAEPQATELSDVPLSLGLPGTLEFTPNPRRLLDDVAEALPDDGTLVAAVSWAPVAPVDAERSFHPASFVGLFVDRFAVTRTHIESGLIGLCARLEPDSQERRSAGHRALLHMQEALEGQLEVGWQSRRQVEAYDAALQGLETAIVAADTERFTARRERNEARAKLRKARERLTELEARSLELEAEVEAATERADHATGRAEEAVTRLRRLESSRWWQLGGILRGVRQTPRGVIAVPGQVWRLWKTSR